MNAPSVQALFLQALSFFILNLLIIVSALRVSLRLTTKVERSGPELIVSTVLLSLCQIVLIESLLGAFGLITYLNVALSVAITYTVLRIWLGKVEPIPLLRSLTFSLSTLSPVESLAILIPAVVFMAYLVTGTGLLPTDGDTLIYHLPMPIKWIQTGSIWSQETHFWFNPANGALLTCWCLLPFKNDLLANIQNYPHLVLAAVALYCLGVRLGCSRKYSIFGAALFSTMPVIRTQIATSNNDLALGGYFLTALLFVVIFKKEGHTSSLLLSGMAGGLLLGTEYSGILYLVVIIILMYVLKGERTTLTDAAVFLTPVFILGGFWYFRNFALTGSPFFPSSLNYFGKPIAIPYPMTYWADTSIAHALSRPHTSYWLAKALLLDGGPATVLCLPVVIYFILRCRKLGWNSTFVLGILPLVLFFIFINMPFSAEYLQGSLDILKGRHVIRWALPYLALGCMGVSLFARIASGGRSLAVEVSILLSIVITASSMLFHYNDLAPVYLGALLLLLLCCAWRLFSRRNSVPLFLGALLSVGIALSFVAAPLIHYRVNKRPRIYGAYFTDIIYQNYTPPYSAPNICSWVDESTRNAKIGVIGLYLYPLAGPWLENSIVTITGKYGTADSLEKALRNNDVDFLVIWKKIVPPYDFPSEDEMASEIFPCVYSGFDAHAYSLRADDKT